MYNDNQDSPADHNAWRVLSRTEEWISNTLMTSNAKAANNPYARKEVSYVCENQSNSAVAISSIFKWLKEAREQGEEHGEAEMERSQQQGTTNCNGRILRVSWYVIR